MAFTHFELQAVNMFGNCIDYVEVFNGESMASLGGVLYYFVCTRFVLASADVVISLLHNCKKKKINLTFVCFSGRFCGFAPPPLLSIPSNTVVIRFLSNGANQQQGFRGYWTTDASVIPTLPPLTPNPWDNITISECGPCPRAALSLMCDHVMWLF